MGTQIAKVEPIKLPDPRRPAILPSLPEWLARSSGAVKTELQLSLSGKSFEDVLVLPAAMLPSPDQRQAMTGHLDSLRCYLRETPALDVVAETRVATAVSKLLMVLAGEKKSELAEEARSDVYLDVLDDVPCWAVEAAVRSWFKHDCGTDEKGRAHDYKWAPDPGTLRRIAQREAFVISVRIGTLQRVLDAREYVDCSAQLADGRAALNGLKRAKAIHPEYARSLTFQDAVKLGNEPESPTTDQHSEAAE